jgi:hypothetical protein
MWNDMENMEETPSWIVKRYKKYMEETQVEMWNDMENMEENFFLTKQLILHVIYLSLYYPLQ